MSSIEDTVIATQMNVEKTGVRGYDTKGHSHAWKRGATADSLNLTTANNYMFFSTKSNFIILRLSID